MAFPPESLMGPIVNLIAVPNTDTTVTFTKLMTNGSARTTQAESLVCVAQCLGQVAQSISAHGESANPHDLTLSGTQPANADCLSLHDMDAGDGKLLTYGIVAEALQGVALQLGVDNTVGGEFQVWQRKWGYVGWGSIGMDSSTPVAEFRQ
ncbi:MAG: hypothetical protein LQ350_003112 [Teloschistes chrysophthalmus]|nr:MAG: hypothetical protein LQ350_003112 [Niorma chrysophthalma]